MSTDTVTLCQMEKKEKQTIVNILLGGGHKQHAEISTTYTME